MHIEAVPEHEHWGRTVVETTVLGHPCLTFAKRRHNIAELLLDARRFPEREYLVQGPRRITFRDHELAVRVAAGRLRELGVGRGDRVLLLGRNSADWIIGFWAVLHAGAVVVLGNAWWSDAELAHGIATSDSALILTDRAFLDRVGPAHARVAFDELAGGRPAGDAAAAPVEEDDPAIILFTSGTTGLPKGAVLSHHGILSIMHSLALRTNRLPTGDGAAPRCSKALLSLPLFHIGGIQQILNPMVMGGTLVFTEGRFDGAAVAELIRREEINVWSAVPTMVTRVIDYAEEAGLPPLTSLRTLGLGGAPVVERLRRRVAGWFPGAAKGLAVTYGLSEAGGVVTTGAGEEVLDRPGTVGRPLPTVTIRIDRPDAFGVGEVLVRAPSVMLGYWRPVAADGTGPDPGGTGAAGDDPVSADRWLHTGDIGWIDADGYLYITDRGKDIVIRGGENIATPHVESRLLEHPAIAEVAVLGLPHEGLGEELGAVVVARDGHHATEEQLRDFARERLAYFEVPSRWWFHPGPLPQNTTGKILKRALRQEWIERDGADEI